MTIDNVFSGSVSGRGIKITTTASPGDLIHTVPPHAEGPPSCWLYAYNNDTVDQTLTIQFGGTTSPDDQFTTTIRSQAGLALIVPALPLGVGLSMRAFASAANKIVVWGWIRCRGEF